MARRSSSRRSSARRPFRAFLWINLAVALLIGGWYLVQPAERQHDVARLVRNTLARDKQVSPLDLAWDIWTLYYAEPAGPAVAGQAGGAFAYGGTPREPAGGAVRVLNNRAYAVGYDDVLAAPRWAAYRLHDLARVGEPPPRPERFSVDRRTTARVEPSDYSGSGYDRGHLAPNYAIAIHYGADAQLETFLMSNIAPQRHALNAGVWKRLEQRIATNYPARYGEVWVLCGPIFGEPPRRLRRGAAVPDAFYLIVLDEKEGQLRAQAFIFPQETPESARPDDFLASIDEIERRTGLDFLPDLSTEAQARIESARAARTW